MNVLCVYETDFVVSLVSDAHRDHCLVVTVVVGDPATVVDEYGPSADGACGDSFGSSDGCDDLLSWLRLAPPWLAGSGTEDVVAVSAVSGRILRELNCLVPRRGRMNMRCGAFIILWRFVLSCRLQCNRLILLAFGKRLLTIRLVRIRFME